MQDTFSSENSKGVWRGLSGEPPMPTMKYSSTLMHFPCMLEQFSVSISKMDGKSQFPGTKNTGRFSSLRFDRSSLACLAVPKFVMSPQIIKMSIFNCFALAATFWKA